MEKTYPLVHQNCEREIIAGASMLYRWPGSGKGGKKPILLMAHQDVVPVTPGTEEDWQHPAFDGVIADGHVWGRGAIDMKNMLCAEFEAMEYLMQRGFTPDRDVYLALGHDEEVGGSGAVATAQHLLEQGVEIDFIMDEGGKPAHGEDFGASDVLVATISVFEKGYCDLQLISRSPGGHSNRPGKTTALGELAKAIVALEASPMPCLLYTSSTLGERVSQRVNELLREGEAERGVILDACASACADAGLDFMLKMRKPYLFKMGYELLSTRFSPGYGDMPLSFQRSLFLLLDAGRLGISLTQGNMLYPEKSVLAVCGVKER